MVIFGAYSWVKWGFPGGSAGKESACNAGDLGSTLGWEDALEKGKAPLQYSGLENSMDCMVHGVAKSWTQLSDITYRGKQKQSPSGGLGDE